jgi:hypothetical protein
LHGNSTPFGRRQFRPSQATGDQIVAVVPDDAQKGFVRINDPPINIPYDDPYDIGVDQPPYFRFPVL